MVTNSIIRQTNMDMMSSLKYSTFYTPKSIKLADRWQY